MRDWSGQVSGLLGVALVLSTLFVHWRRRWRRRRAQRAFPALAESLGLQHVPGEFTGDQGVLRGAYRGFQVVVDPDEDRTISVRFSGRPRVDLRSIGSSEDIPADMLLVASDDAEFNRFWKTRRASAAIAEKLEAADTRAWIAPFKGKFADRVRSLLVSADGVTCELDCGTPPYMPVDAVSELLAGCVALAAVFEPEASGRDESVPAEPLAERPITEASRSIPHRFGAWLVLVGLVALLVELGLAWCTHGTSDGYALEQLARWTSYIGAGVYAAAEVPHPAPVLSLLVALRRLAEATNLPFAFWLRLAAALANTGALALAHALMTARLGETRVRAGLLLLAASPPLLLVAGFHGSVHPIMAFWLLLSVYVTQRRGSDLLAGAAFGLAACFAILPVAALPVLLLCRPTWARRGRFVAAASALLAAGWGPWLGPDLSRLLGQRQPEPWGLSWLVLQLAPGAAGLRFLAVPVLLAGSIALGAWLHRRSPRPSPYAQVGIVVAAWLALEPAFGVQDLSWLGPWLIGLPVAAVSFHVVCATALAIVTYSHGSGALLGYFVDMGAGAGESAAPTDHQRLLCWLSVVLVLGVALAALRPRRLAVWDFAPEGLRRALLLAAAIAAAWPSMQHLRRSAGREPLAAAPSPERLRARGDINLSLLLLRAGRNRDGIEVAQAAVQREPTRALAWNNLAVGYAGLERWDDAIAAAQRALELSPDLLLARNNLAWAQQRQAEAQALPGSRGRVARGHRTTKTRRPSYQPASDAVSP